MTWLLLLMACPPDPDTGDTATTPELEVLDPEPAGAPVDPADGRLTCVGNNAPPDPVGGAVELTGYVRTLADPTASAAPPAAQVDVYDAGGALLATSFADSSKDGRVAVSVPVPDAGFTGWVRVTDPGYLPWRFQSSRPVTAPEANGWTWLTTDVERDELSTTLGLTVSDDDGEVVGAVHDCDGFGVANVVVVLDGDPDGVVYTEAFELATWRSYTGSSGRFVAPALAPGAVTVKAFGRLEAGGPLVLLSSVATTVEAGSISAVALEPSTGD